MDQTPWLIPGAVQALEGMIPPDASGWEWGSGGSTVWLARRMRDLVSVEHDGEWVATVQERLRHFGLGNVTQLYIRKGDCYYWAYADAILSAPDGAFDVVLVDGRNRPRCLVNALAKMRRGGVLVLDDSQRLPYQEAIAQVPATWARQDYEGWENERKVTTIWRVG